MIYICNAWLKSCSKQLALWVWKVYNAIKRVDEGDIYTLSKKASWASDEEVLALEIPYDPWCVHAIVHHLVLLVFLGDLAREIERGCGVGKWVLCCCALPAAIQLRRRQWGTERRMCTYLYTHRRRQKHKIGRPISSAALPSHWRKSLICGPAGEK
jgi:hypothetical protein